MILCFILTMLGVDYIYIILLSCIVQRSCSNRPIICRGLLGGSPTLANLGNDHGFISKEYISICMRPFGEAQSKTMRIYAQSGQYHTIVVIPDS